MAMYLYKLYRLTDNGFAGNVQVPMNPTEYAADLAGSTFYAVADGQLPDPVTAVINQTGIAGGAGIAGGGGKTTGTTALNTTLSRIFGGGSVQEPNDALRQGGGAVDSSGGQVSLVKVGLIALGVWLITRGKW